MSAASLRTSWLGAATIALTALTALSLAVPAQASGGGGGSGGGGSGGGGGGTVSPAIASVTFSPSPVIGGGGDTATVTFVSAPSQGAVVHLASSNRAVAGFQENVLNSDEVVVPPGHLSATFAVVTTSVTAATPVTITATAFGTTTVNATLTVSPGTPPAADTVHVTKFEWNRGIQSIQATSSNPHAVLNVFDQDGTFTGITLTSQGGGVYSDQQSEVFPPDQPIVVKSNFGGSGTATAKISN
jgi:hypothetical protein